MTKRANVLIGTMPRGHHWHRQSGFTLIEMLVSLALVVLLVALLPNALGLGRRAWEAHEDVGQRLAALAGLGVLEQRLAEAVPAFSPETGGIAFQGEAREVTFIAPARLASIAGLARWTLRLAPPAGPGTAGSGTLQLVAEPYMISPDGGGQTPLVTELGAPVQDFALAYFGRSAEGESPRWHEAWPRNDALPLLVAVATSDPIAGAGASRRLVVALKLAAP